MASGNWSLELTDSGSWESFPKLAKEFCSQVGAKIIEKLDGPDVTIWDIEYHGSVLRLVYDDYPNGISVEPKDSNGQSAVDKLYELVFKQKMMMAYNNTLHPIRHRYAAPL